ncbi:MAG: AAA family ATPase [Patescibacteria group bacterium]|nr:AAA family ATPase [Patescibacteria group bacterium]
MFKPATKEKSKLRLALMGPAGSGKTYTALAVGSNLGKKIALIDSERGSASKYADLFKFDVCELESHHPDKYIGAIKDAERAGYDVLIIDSLSHAWMGKDGVLEFVDKEAAKAQSNNSFAAWRKATPLHNDLVDAVLNSPCHVVVTMRSKMEYVLEENERGKKVPRKVGMAPVQRDGVEYEFDVTADLNLDHDLIVGKTRCHLVDGLVVRKPGKEFAEKLLGWLENGTTSAPNKSESADPKPATNAEQCRASESSAQSTNTNGAQSQSTTANTTGSSSQSESAEKKPVSTSGQSAAQEAAKDVSNSASTASKEKDSPKVTPDQMKHLLKAGEANGWTRAKISQFVCFAFKYTPQTVSNLTEKQWDIALRLVMRPENKNGVVSHDAGGKLLAEANRWPQPTEAK